MKKEYSILMIMALIIFFILQPTFSSAQDELQIDESGDLSALNEIKRTYLTSDKLTEITFTREVSVPYNSKTGIGTMTESASFKITGYLKEIDPGFADRAFEFDNGTIEWTLNQNSNDGDEKCTHIIEVSSSGKDKIGNLNVFYEITDGMATSISGSHLPSSGKLSLKYNKESLAGESEFSLIGEVLIPVDITETIEVHHRSPNIKTVCNGLTETTMSVKKRSATLKFPLTFLGLDLKDHSYSDNIIAREGVENELKGTVISSNLNAKFGSIVLVAPVGFLGTDGPWQISLNVELPYLDTEKDSDRDGLPDIRESSFGTDPNNPDTDNDGLLDGWETLGVFKGGNKIIDLPSMGANPLVQDLFLEIDWMENNAHTHKPEDRVIQRVVNAFARRNIQLHIDIGQWGGGNSIPDQPGSEWHKSYLNATAQTAYEANNQYLFDIKKNNFDSNRLGIFYYGIFVHQKEGTSGQANMGGNFYVALRWNASIPAKSGTLMHEFGHTLQLGHGGRLDKELQYDNTHFKPNYRSIMNYHFQLNGLPRDDLFGNIIYYLDYSNEELIDLDENAGLNENAGMTSSVNTKFISYYTCRDNGHGINAKDVYENIGNDLKIRFQLNGSPVDWNCDGIINGNPAVNVNGNGNNEYDALGGTKEVLVGRKDWDKIVLKIGCPSYGLDKDFSSEDIIWVSEELDNCPEHDEIRNSLGVPELDDRYPPELPFLGEACDGVDNDEDGDIDEGCLDTDGDEIVDDLDNCIYAYNPDQTDSDKDFVGDACVDSYIAKANEGIKQPEVIIKPKATKEKIAVKEEVKPKSNWFIILAIVLIILAAGTYFVYKKKFTK